MWRLWQALAAASSFCVGHANVEESCRSASLLQLTHAEAEHADLVHYTFGHNHCDNHSPEYSCGTEKKTSLVSMPTARVSRESCPLCGAGDSSPVALYGIERKDGLGQRVVSALLVMAYAHRYNVSLAGFIFKESDDDVHHADVVKSFDAYFGMRYADLRINVTRPHFDHCWDDDFDRLPWEREATILFRKECRPLEGRREDFTPLLTPSLLTRLQQTSGLVRMPTRHYKSKQLRVAVHVRRGDVTFKNHITRARFVPDEYYVKLFELLKPLVAPDEIHVFSTTSEKKHITSANFTAFRRAGTRLHLDGDMLEDWAHLAQADLLILAPSSYSWAAGILNRNCVAAWGDFSFHNMPSWTLLGNETAKLSDGLSQIQDCLQGLRAKG